VDASVHEALYINYTKGSQPGVSLPLSWR